MNQGDYLPNFRFLGFALDVRNRSLSNPDGEPVPLNSRAFDVLLTLVKNHGKTVSKADLMASAWSSTVVEDNNLNQAIFSIRRALEDNTRKNRFIRTISGRGYCFVAPVETLSSPGGATAHGNDPQLDASAYSWFSWQARIPRKYLYLANLCLLIVASVALLSPLLRASHQEPVPQAMYSVAGQPAATAEAHENRNTIAVLPFTSPELNREQQLFAIGLHDEVISQLSKIRSLDVIARNSILSLVRQGYGMAEIADLLNVGSFVSGSTLFSGDQARIILSMHDAESGITRWSGNYEVNKQDLVEMFSIQSEIAINLAQALEAEILQPEQDNITRVPTTSVDAYRYHLSGSIAHYKQDYANEWLWTKKAIELDQDFYDAHAAFSTVNTVLVSNPLPGMSSRDHYRMALDSAEKLIALDPMNTKGYALKAIAMSTNKDWDQVFSMVENLLQIDAPLSNLNLVALILLCSGDYDRAIDIYRANLRTEPLNLYGRGFLMVALELAGRREESRLEFLAGEALSDFWWGDIVNIFLALGRGEQIREIDELVNLSESHRNILKKVNAGQDIRAELHAYRQTENKVSAVATHYAALAAYAGEQDLAIEFMHAALEDNWSAVFWSWLPVFDQTRKTEGFKAILVEAGLVRHWQESGWPEVCQPHADSFQCNWTAY